MTADKSLPFNCSKKIRQQKRLKLLNFLGLPSFDLIFVTETWLYQDIEVCKVFPLLNKHSIFAKRDRSGGENSGVLKEDKNDFNFNYSELNLIFDQTLKNGQSNDSAVDFSFLSIKSHIYCHMFLGIYNRATVSPYGIEANLLADWISSCRANLITMFPTLSPFWGTSISMIFVRQQLLVIMITPKVSRYKLIKLISKPLFLSLLVRLVAFWINFLIPILSDSIVMWTLNSIPFLALFLLLNLPISY